MLASRSRPDCCAILVAVLACCILATHAANFMNPIIPEPQTAQYGAQSVHISQASFALQTTSASLLLARAIKRTSSSIFRFGPGSANSSVHAAISVVVKDASEELSFGVGTWSGARYFVPLRIST